MRFGIAAKQLTLLQGLELAFIDALASAADVGNRRGQLCAQLCSIALGLEQAVARQIAFAGQLTQALEFLLLKLQLKLGGVWDSFLASAEFRLGVDCMTFFCWTSISQRTRTAWASFSLYCLIVFKRFAMTWVC